MAEKKQPPKAVRDIGEAIARAMGIDPSKVEIVRASEYGMPNAASSAKREKTLDELFDLHMADALSVVEAAKEQKFDQACCNDCAVRAVAAGQVEGAVRALLKLNVEDGDMFAEVAAMHGLITHVLQDILEERKATEGEGEEQA